MPGFIGFEVGLCLVCESVDCLFESRGQNIKLRHRVADTAEELEEGVDAAVAKALGLTLGCMCCRIGKRVLRALDR